MAYPALFRHLFGDNPVRPFKFRKELIPLDVDKFNQWYDQMETWRKSLIGCLIPTTMATLPSCLGIPDGSLFLFEDYPELKEKYDAGGFNGMLLESTATSEEKDAWRGKWIKHPQGLGLYAPRLQGLFLRNAERTGQYNTPGIPNVSGVSAVPVYASLLSKMSPPYKKIETALTASCVGSIGTVSVSGRDMSTSNSIHGASDTVMPASADTIFGLYLGRPTEV